MSRCLGCGVWGVVPKLFTNYWYHNHKLNFERKTKMRTRKCGKQRKTKYNNNNQSYEKYFHLHFFFFGVYIFCDKEKNKMMTKFSYICERKKISKLCFILTRTIQGEIAFCSSRKLHNKCFHFLNISTRQHRLIC